MRFRSRVEAGQALGKQMARGAWTDPLVLALPRGGVPVAEHVALAIGAQLDVIVSRKIGSPFNPEMGIGAVGPDGNVVLDQPLISRLKVDAEYIENVSSLQLDETRRRLSAYRGARPSPKVSGRAVIVVDDAIAGMGDREMVGVARAATMAPPKHACLKTGRRLALGLPEISR